MIGKQAIINLLLEIPELFTDYFGYIQNERPDFSSWLQLRGTFHIAASA